MTSKKDLWGDLPNIETIRTPYTILKEQASVLTEKTKGLLIGEVTRGSRDQAFVALLRIKVPSLNNYIYSVVDIQYPITKLYPVSMHNFATADDRKCECSNEAEFEDALGKILSSSNVKRVISALLAEVHADISQPQYA